MELALSSFIGVLVAAGVYLLLRARSFEKKGFSIDSIKWA